MPSSQRSRMSALRKRREVGSNRSRERSVIPGMSSAHTDDDSIKANASPQQTVAWTQLRCSQRLNFMAVPRMAPLNLAFAPAKPA